MTRKPPSANNADTPPMAAGRHNSKQIEGAVNDG
jgi:hypothetical protein